MSNRGGGSGSAVALAVASAALFLSGVLFERCTAPPVHPSDCPPPRAMFAATYTLSRPEIVRLRRSWRVVSDPARPISRQGAE